MTFIARTLVVFMVLAGVARTSEAQSILVEVMALYGIEVPGNNFEAAFDAGVAPTVPLTPGAFATPVGMLEVETGGHRDRGQVKKITVWDDWGQTPIIPFAA